MCLKQCTHTFLSNLFKGNVCFRQRKPRPRQLLTNNGKHVLNLWFIPHHTEALTMFKKLNDVDCVCALTYNCMIVGAIHDMLHYLCAHARLGSSHARLGSRKMEFVSADWGGTEGIGKLNQYLKMLALPVSEIVKIFGTPLGFTLQPHVKMLPIDPYLF